jgi:hypothetical protein
LLGIPARIRMTLISERRMNFAFPFDRVHPPSSIRAP